MHLILTNYRSGSSTFGKDWARELGVPFIGDVFGEQSNYDEEFKKDFLNKVLNGLPINGVVKIYPLDIINLKHIDSAELLEKLIYKSKGVVILSKKNFDDILLSYLKSELLKNCINIPYNEAFTITYPFDKVPRLLYRKVFYNVLDNSIQLAKIRHIFKEKIRVLWYDDIFEKESKLNRNVIIGEDLPSNNINIEKMFYSFEPKLLPLPK